MNLVSWHQRTYGVLSTDRAAQTAAPAFDACGWEVWPYLASGASLHIVDHDTRSSPDDLLRWFVEQGITLSFLVTPLAEAFLKEVAKRNTRPGLRALLTGGDKLGVVEDRDYGFELWNHYGPTESSVVATWGVVKPGAADEPPIGRPIANTHAYVLDGNLRRLPAGVPGELFISSASLARGYWRQPTLTAEKFMPDPFSQQAGARMYRTGDLVKYLADGNLRFLGRTDQQIKLRGYRIEPGEIEAVLAQTEGVQDAVVVLRVDERNGEKLLAAYLTAKPGVTLSEPELKDHARQRLPEYMVPGAFVVLPEMPLTANGKVDRKALPAPDRNKNERPEQYVSARTDIERTLAEIWQRVLGLDRIGINDNFFEAGGTSLLVLKLRDQMEVRLGQPVSVADLFQHPTIRHFAEHLATSGNKSGSSEAEDRAGVRLKMARRRSKTPETSPVN
jgi:acyl-coenzyme A synthetase/AMP-(fatty) acid ligase